MRLLNADEFGSLDWHTYKLEDIDQSIKGSKVEFNKILPRHQALKLLRPDLHDLLRMKKHHDDLFKKKDA